MALPNEALTGKVALVTGAGSGIGRATAIGLAAAGVTVALVGHTRPELEETENTIARAGGRCLVGVADVADVDAVDAVVAQVRTTWDRLDIVVANAGVNGVWAPLEGITPEEWDRTIAINLRGTFLTVRASLPLLKRAGGAIVVVSSVNGTRMFSNTGATAYAASKAAQVAFARMMALELAPQRIRVNTVCPGSIQTHIDDNTDRRDLQKIKTPVKFPAGVVPLTGGEPGSAEQVAALIAFLVSDAAGHITGTEVFIDGAQSLLQG